jgi:GT2 family glycosyltransferase
MPARAAHATIDLAMPDNSTVLPNRLADHPLGSALSEALTDPIDPDFDEVAYLRTYPDVAAAVQRGELKSGLHHYLFAGKAERRLQSPRYRQNVSAQFRNAAEFKASVEPAQTPPVSVEALILSDSGAVFLIGWTDDRHNPLVAMTLRIGEAARRSWTQFPRVRRRDVEASLHFTGSYQHGFWAFSGTEDAAGPRHVPRGAECTIELCYANGAVVEMNRAPALVADAELRDTAMRYLATCEYWGNRWVEAFGSLDDGAGDAFIDFNRSISHSFAAQALVECFGQVQRRPKVSIIVAIYGIADYLFLQSCIYAQGRDIGAYEFIYVVNSPELIEKLCREARIAQMIYGLPQTLVALPGNVGFGTANNVGARFARSDRLLCLNPDVFPSDADWARRHLDVLGNLPEAQSRLFGSSLYYDDGSLMHGGMYFEIDAGFHTGATNTTRRSIVRVEHYGKGAPPWATQYVESRPVPAVTGAFISIDRAWFEKLGGFTEDYIFGHYEDADLCLKSLRAGTPAWLHDVRMWHLEGKGSRRLPQHEGGSLVNRWHFSRTWIPTIVPDLVGKNPQHRLLRTAVEAPAALVRRRGAKPTPSATPVAATPVSATPVAATPVAATPVAATPDPATPVRARANARRTR